MHPRRMHNTFGTHMRRTSRYGRTRIIHIHITRHAHIARVGCAGLGSHGTFSTPEGVRWGWSLNAVYVYDTVAKPSRRGMFDTIGGAHEMVPERGRYPCGSSRA
eukprot:1604247-Pyramimonas_sp.AAC.1